jgi:DNA-binding NarL/FixJ family response regulator
MSVVFEAKSAQEVLDAIDDLTIDVLVVDHRLSGNDGVWLVEQINRRAFAQGDFPMTTIVSAPFFSVELDIAVMRCGAFDFVVEEAGAEELLSAIRNSTLNNRGLEIAPLIDLFQGANVVRKSWADFDLKLANLDSKLNEILELFELGCTDEQIAEKTGSSAMRVRQLFKRLLNYFAFATRAQLALALFEAGRFRG